MMHRETETRNGTGFRPLVTLLVAAFVVTMAVVVACRLSRDAIAVLVGVIAGVGAGIPTALLLVAVTRRREEEWAEPYDEAPRGSPPVIVVTSGTPPQPQVPYYSPYSLPTGMPRHQRQFRVMGDDEEDDQVVEHDPADMSWER
jgi:hypothetical protein